MAAKTAKPRRAVQSKKRSDPASPPDSVVRGLYRDKGINMTEALKGFIGSGSGPGDLSINKEYFRDFGRARIR